MGQSKECNKDKGKHRTEIMRKKTNKPDNQSGQKYFQEK